MLFGDAEAFCAEGTKKNRIQLINTNVALLCILRIFVANLKLSKIIATDFDTPPII